MAQMTIRTSDELLDRVRRAAEHEGQSMNEYVTATLNARANPDSASTEVERIRERLAQAGLLAEGSPSRKQRPDRHELARARTAAGEGTPLSDLVGEERG